jgi:undecaprenyl-diphosphatase
MIWYYILLYALIQGITEFLPISSSGHLILAHEWVNGQMQNAAQDDSARWAQDAIIDIAVHVGTLFSVLLYFWRDFYAIIRGVILSCIGRTGAHGCDDVKQGRNAAFYIIIASVPVIIAGYLLHKWQPEWLRSAEIVAWTTLIFAYVLWLADRFCPSKLDVSEMTLKTALLVGFAQILALIPGTSRSGITMTAARTMGYTREAAAKFSLFLSVVAISGAGLLAGMDVLKSENVQLGADAAIAAAVSFVAGYCAIAVMIKWLRRHDFTPFVLYRALLGLVLLLIVYL